MSIADQPRAITQEMRYGNKPIAVESELKRAIVMPTTGSGTYEGNTSTVIEFELPTGRPGEFIDFQQTYLKFAIENFSDYPDTNATNLNDDEKRALNFVLDNSAHCVINRLTVYYGSTIVEDVTNYNLLATLLKDLHDDEQTQSHKLSCHELMADSTEPQLKGRGCSIAPGAKVTACIQLISGSVGILLNKLVPVHAMPFPIRIVLHLENPNVCLRRNPNKTFGTGATQKVANWTTLKYRIIDPTFFVTYIHTDPQVAKSTIPSDGVYKLATQGWRNYTTQVQPQTSYISIPISARYASIKTLYGIMRPDASKADPYRYSLSNRTKNWLDSYQLRIGSQVIPNSTIDCKSSAEVFMELLRTMHGMNVSNFPMKFQRTRFMNDYGNQQLPGLWQTVNFGVEHWEERGQFIIPLEMESLIRNSDKLMSGMDARASDLFLDLKFGSETVQATSVGPDYKISYTETFALNKNGARDRAVFDTFINFDKYIVIQPATGQVAVEI